MAEADDKALVAQILSSYLSNNSVSPADLPSVIETIKRSFGGGGSPPLSLPATDKGRNGSPPFRSENPSRPTRLFACATKEFERSEASSGHRTSFDAGRISRRLQPRERPPARHSELCGEAFGAGGVSRSWPQGGNESARAEQTSSRRAAAKNAAE